MRDFVRFRLPRSIANRCDSTPLVIPVIVAKWPPRVTATLLALLVGINFCVAAKPVVKSSSPNQQPTRPEAVETFLMDQCSGCHDGAGGEGGFDLASLSNDLDDRSNFEKWVRVFDRIENREMPPPEDFTLEQDEIDSFLKPAEQFLVSHQKRMFDRQGRVRGRQLTPQQVERTLGDLFAVEAPVSSLVPDPPRTEGFDGIATNQPISLFQLESHLTMVDAVLDRVRHRLTSKTMKPIDLAADEIAEKKKGQRNRNAEMHKGAAVAWHTRMPFYPRIRPTTVPRSGWYDIELVASGLNIPKEQSEGGQSLWCSMRSGRLVSSAPLLNWIGSLQLTEQKQTYRFTAYMEEDTLLEIRTLDRRLPEARFGGGQVGLGEGAPQGKPGIAMHHLKLTPIFPAGDADKIQRQTFGEIDIDIDRKWRDGEIEIDDNVDPSVIHEQIRVFANRAFRRPVESKITDMYVEFFDSLRDQKVAPIDALMETYRAVLTSPRFLYFTEDAGPLDSFAYAQRLSYLLTGSMADEPLMRDADRDRLRDDDVVTKHVDRMTDGDGLRSFVNDFADRWLDLHDIDFTEPDPRRFKDFDPIVQAAMVDEVQMFLTDAFERNAPITSLYDCDHTFLNSRLADYYGIEGVEHGEMTRVELPPSSQRGGLLSMGAILKVTAAGNDTSPIVRGVWVSERLLGCEIPPPPASVPAIEPDTRGATTIREQLTAHLTDPSCAACHQNIDPPGYALEVFDAAGGYRTDYVTSRRGKKRSKMPIDASATMADGRSFETFEEFKSVVTSQPRLLARNLAAKLITFGTGGTIEMADRRELDRIVDDAIRRGRANRKDDKKADDSKADDANVEIGVADILDAVVTSDLFRRK